VRLVGFLAIAGVYALVVYGLVAAGAPVEEVTPDPSSVTGSPSHVGLGSMIGLMMWAGAGAAALTAAFALRAAGRRPEEVRFLGATGLLALFAGLDDAALFHENIAPGRLGVPQRVVLAAYAAIALAWLVRFRVRLRRSDLLLLALAGACFAVSILIDQVWTSRVVEDSFKYLGLAAFLVYVAREAHASLVAPIDAEDLWAERHTASHN
jgi:hypothetical protein